MVVECSNENRQTCGCGKCDSGSEPWTRWRISKSCTKQFLQISSGQFTQVESRSGQRKKVLTLRPEEWGSQKLFVDMSRDPERKMEIAFDGGGLGSVVPGTILVNQRGTVDTNAPFKKNALLYILERSAMQQLRTNLDL